MSCCCTRASYFRSNTARLKACHDASNPHPTRPNSRLSRAWATATATIREISHPQLYIPINGLRWASPPPLGRVLVLLGYWAVVVYFMSWNVVIKDDYFWERIGYRNAWVTITQLPMLYLLSMKTNPIGFLIGTSHERLNWLHRWVARTMFVTATVHGFHFWSQWVIADFVAYELSFMPLVKYGLAAWGILLWSVVVGLLPIRRLAYEVWLLQHIVSGVVILWLLYKHIPADARYLLWMAISFLVFDRAARWLLLLWQNTRWKPNKSTCEGMKRIGHHVSAQAVGPSTTVLTVKDVHFKWTAGQHVYLWVPRIGMLEAHPYTIACAHQIRGTCCCNSIQLIIRAHGGFSKRIHNFARKQPNVNVTGFLSGPYGAPPRWDVYETMVLIGASTGASFVIPLLESAATAEGKMCVKRIEVALMAKTAEELSYYVERVKEAAQTAADKGIDVRLHIAITGSSQQGKFSVLQAGNESSSSGDEQQGEKTTLEEQSKEADVDIRHSSSVNSTVGSKHTASVVREYTSRLDIESLIREPVEAAWGETAVVVCGGRDVVARTRNCVSSLSDERAVHKGTGAQGIYLHVEEYSF